MTSSDRLERLREAVEGALGPVEGLEVPPGGDARMVRARVRLADGRTPFAKLALHPQTAAALGREELVYRLGRPWHPRVVVAGDGPLLVVEDLAEARWPPPWPEELEPLWVALAEVAEVSPPAGLDELEDPPDLWAAIEARPGPVAALGVVEATWITRHAGALSDAARRVTLEGGDLVHADLGAENVCFAERGAVLVDWEHAARGSRWLDAATVSVDLVAAGRSPAPGLPDPGAWGSLLAAVAARAASGPIPSWAAGGEELRGARRRSFAVALRWACRELGLEPSSGPSGGW